MGRVSTAGELGVEGEGVEDVGERGGRGSFRGSFTLPSKGRGTPGVPGRWRGGAWRGTKGSLTVPGRGSLGGSPSNDPMRGGGPILLPLGPSPLRSTPSGLTERGRSTGTSTPPTMTAVGTAWWVGGGEGRWGMGGGGRGIGGGGPKKWDGGGGCWWRSDGGGVWMLSV